MVDMNRDHELGGCTCALSGEVVTLCTYSGLLKAFALSNRGALGFVTNIESRRENILVIDISSVGSTL